MEVSPTFLSIEDEGNQKQVRYEKLTRGRARTMHSVSRCILGEQVE